MQTNWVKKGRVIGPFGVFSTLLITSFLLVIAGVSVAGAWYKISLKPKGGNVTKIFVIGKGETAREIVGRLEEEGLIKSAFAFRIYLSSSGFGSKIQTGTFRLSSNQSALELAQELQGGELDKWVTLVEGLRDTEMAAILAKEFAISEENFISAAKEGYMFPDTYLVPVDTSAEKIVTILRKNFDKKVDTKVRDQAKKEGLTLNELITLASIVERESKTGSERPIIAGILLKRFKEGIPLGADATVQYALGYQSSEKTWWKKILTDEDLQTDSPYNTRKFAGLPPTPICNPGLAAIKAAADPKFTNYNFYLHDPQGKVHFAETLEEHNANIAKHLR